MQPRCHHPAKSTLGVPTAPCDGWWCRIGVRHHQTVHQPALQLCSPELTRQQNTPATRPDRPRLSHHSAAQIAPQRRAAPSTAARSWCSGARCSARPPRAQRAPVSMARVHAAPRWPRRDGVMAAARRPRSPVASVAAVAATWRRRVVWPSAPSRRARGARARLAAARALTRGGRRAAGGVAACGVRRGGLAASSDLRRRVGVCVCVCVSGCTWVAGGRWRGGRSGCARMAVGSARPSRSGVHRPKGWVDGGEPPVDFFDGKRGRTRRWDVVCQYY